MPRIAGGVSTWLQNTLKLVSRLAAASLIANAVGGVVVSKPMAKNTTSRFGSTSAIAIASSVEYTMRMSAPAALARSSEVPCEPGTRIRSP